MSQTGASQLCSCVRRKFRTRVVHRKSWSIDFRHMFESLNTWSAMLSNDHILQQTATSVMMVSAYVCTHLAFFVQLIGLNLLLFQGFQYVRRNGLQNAVDCHSQVSCILIIILSHVLHSTQCTVLCAQYSRHSTQCTVLSTQYSGSVHSTQCTLLSTVNDKKGTKSKDYNRSFQVRCFGMSLRMRIWLCRHQVYQLFCNVLKVKVRATHTAKASPDLYSNHCIDSGK